MDNIRTIKQEIKEEIPDENEQQYGDNISVIQNVKYESPEFEDDYGNYEYATVTTVTDAQEEQELDFETDLGSQQLKIKPNSFSTQRMIDFDEDEDEDEDEDVHQIHKQYENEIYVDGEPLVEDISDSYSKENASDPLAINTKMVYLNDSHPKTILNATHTPLASSSVKKLVRRLPPSQSPTVLLEKRPVGRPPQMPSIYVLRKTPTERPVKELVRKTYSQKHRLTSKTSVSNICYVCSRSFQNPVEFEKHKRRCFFKCKKCNLICGNEVLLKIHHQNCTIQNNDQKSKRSKCDKSKFIAVEKKILMDSCDICCMKFNSSDELDKHRKEKHFFANSYACHLCTKKFETNFDAVCHLKQDH